jgi:hypothetical protein
MLVTLLRLFTLYSLNYSTVFCCYLPNFLCIEIIELAHLSIKIEICCRYLCDNDHRLVCKLPAVVVIFAMYYREGMR